MTSRAELTPTQKGNIAEAAIAAHAVRLGIAVLKPVVEGLRYDLVFDTGDRLWRVQCKWTPYVRGVVRVAARTCRYTPLNGYVRTVYSPAEVDLIAGFCADLDKVYAFPVTAFHGQSMMDLRVDPARNNQSLLVNWAHEYELGAVAQLGERVTGSHEVRGSSPLSSTQRRPPDQAAFVFPAPPGEAPASA